MKLLSQSEALNMTPESMTERIIVSAEAARETDKASIKQAQGLLREAHADQMRAIGAIRTKDRQRRHMVFTGIGTGLAVSLLWLFYPGLAASLAPAGWHWPKRLATRTMGDPSPWEAGIRLMRTGNPEGWKAGRLEGHRERRRHGAREPRRHRSVREGGRKGQWAGAMPGQD
ncbi:hypothetical protein BV97_05756 [Novosphingobium resinovorum]|uniref:Uncharacterized protein n=1 Tax=Novosphingobium resinovorum TaxID=158500 RepID=A0A031IZE6_9SPHN|nr:hypothetical protein [Novosphingobium resinovorum]EZP66361.1 hypothetical protein BV97_05756 [Novosphingobium resinovorum]